MTNRTTAAIITVIMVILCGCPGLLFLCNASLALIEMITNYRVQIIGYGYNAPYALVGSLCIGILAIVVTVLVAYFVLRQKKGTLPPPPPVPPSEPLPPTI